MDSESKKGKRCLVNKENKYREYYRKKNENVCWRCTIKSCKARVETENGTVVKDFGLHTHVDNEIMSRMPNDDLCRRFADYVVE